jgi:CDP-glycerol glycerophosphotransferase
VAHSRTRSEPTSSSRLYSKARSAAGQVRRRVRNRREARELPVLSAVVPAYNVRAYIGECLDSLLDSTLRALEVIVVDDGSTDDTLAIARRYAAKDHRVKVFTQTNSGQGIARNVGVDHARGRFLTFIDADDTVPPQALALMVRTLEQTGSDFVVGSARRFLNDTFRKTGWAHTVHQKDRFGVTIESFPLAMQDIIACNRVFRTEFWRAKVGGFRGHIAYEDHVPMLTAYVRAQKFDVLSRTTYNWRIREDLTSTSQQKASLENLLDRIAVKEEAYAMLRAEAPDSVYDTWVARVLEVDFPVFIQHALASTEMYRNLLSATYRTFLERASDEVLAEVRYFQKLRGWLVAQERWSDLEAAEAYFRDVGNLPPTEVVDGRVLAEPRDFLEGAPAVIRELSPLETRFDGAMERARWVDGRLELTGWGLIRGLDTRNPPATRAWLEESATGERFDVALEQVVLPEATLWARNLNANYDGTGFRVLVDPAGLPVPDQDEIKLTLHFEVEHLGVRRAGAIHRQLLGGSAVNATARVTETGGTAARVAPALDRELGYGVTVSHPRARLVEVSPGRGRTVRGTLASATRPSRVIATAGRTSTHADPTAAGDGLWSFELELPRSPRAGDDIRLDLAYGDGTELAVAWGLGHDSPTGAAPGLHWERSRAGTCRIRSTAGRIAVTGIEVEDELVLTLSADSHTVESLSELTLRNERLAVRPSRVDVDADRALVAFPLTAGVLGGPALPLPPGSYRLVSTGPGATTGRAASTLLEEMPLWVRRESLLLRFSIPAEGTELAIAAQPPLRDEERTMAGQRELQSAYQAAEYPAATTPTDSVLFGCYRGEFATDSQRALDEGLRVARPDLVRYWGVESYAVEVPEGSVPLLMGSREWYDALASSAYLCNNIDFDGFFRKRPHQKYLQTFHGYPFKSMGRGFWAGKGYSEERIARELARRNAEYDAILVPSETAAGYYRSEYDFTGRILVTGYPRSDFMVNANQDKVRAEVLGRLGISPDRTTVLYAPTYRDNLTTRTYAAKRFEELDLTRLTRMLGDDVVVLLRGHNNNQREADRVSELPGVVDVTDYPEINHLTVAADAAILDYSSLRFDWALTGKPMVFFVPDIDDYFAKRPPLFRFEDSAPGPWHSTTEQVAESLSDLDALLAGQKADLESFNATYNALHDGSATQRVIDQFFR